MVGMLHTAACAEWSISKEMFSKEIFVPNSGSKGLFKQAGALVKSASEQPGWPFSILLPKKLTSHLKIDGWKTNISF